VTPIHDEISRQALVHLLSLITGKTHSRIISKLNKLGIKNHPDFVRKLGEIENDKYAELEARHGSR